MRPLRSLINPVTLVRLVVVALLRPLAVFLLGMWLAWRFVHGPRRRQRLVWGTTPLISNKYWSRAMRAGGWESETLMHSHYSLYKRDDYDRYYEDTLPPWLRSRTLRNRFAPYFAFLHILERASVVHLPFHGGPLGRTIWWRWESRLLRRAGIRTILLPYGADAYLYSRIVDPTLRHALLMSYPLAAREERTLAARVEHWVREADAVIPGCMLDAFGRWDVLVPSPFCIDLDHWSAKQQYTMHDGRTGPVRVLHTPNHRGFKGTEFIIRAVDTLRAEGLQVELELLEGIPNDEVQRRMLEADVLAEQFVATAYAMSGIEGMASGLCVMANLENPLYTTVWRRYSFLGECPIVSASPESLTDRLRMIVTNPQLRVACGRAGRAYVEKYHSYAAARLLFESVYRSFAGDKVDLLTLFHPLLGVHARREAPIPLPAEILAQSDTVREPSATPRIVMP